MCVASLPTKTPERISQRVYYPFAAGAENPLLTEGWNFETHRPFLVNSFRLPESEKGTFHQQFEWTKGAKPGMETSLILQIPTWEVNPVIPVAYYSRRFREDPVLFMADHSAKFSTVFD